MKGLCDRREKGSEQGLCASFMDSRLQRNDGSGVEPIRSSGVIPSVMPLAQRRRSPTMGKGRVGRGLVPAEAEREFTPFHWTEEVTPSEKRKFFLAYPGMLLIIKDRK